MRPVVSVIMPVHNGESHVLASVKSVLGQDLYDIELLVADDGSTDRTVEMLASVDDPRLVVHSLPANHGAAYARNLLLPRATGEWITFIDADDLWHPARITRLLTYASRVEGPAVLSDRVRFTVPDRHGRMRVARTQPRQRGQHHSAGLVEVSRRHFAARGFAFHPFFRRELLTAGAVFPVELRILHDYGFVIQLLNQPGVRFFQAKDALYYAQVRSNSLTAEGGRIEKMRTACHHLLAMDLRPELQQGLRDFLQAIDATADRVQLGDDLRRRRLGRLARRTVRDPRTVLWMLQMMWNSARYRFRPLLLGIKAPSRERAKVVGVGAPDPSNPASDQG